MSAVLLRSARDHAGSSTAQLGTIAMLHWPNRQSEYSSNFWQGIADLGICSLTWVSLFVVSRHFALVSGVSRNRNGTTGSELAPCLARCS